MSLTSRTQAPKGKKQLTQRAPVRAQEGRRDRGAFDRFANAGSNAAGRPWAFAAAVAVLAVWAVSGPVFGFSDTWQLIINTGTTIVTFLMVFLIQHTQNKDSKALQLKLDSLIAATAQVSNRLLDLEDLSDAELDHLHRRYSRLASDSPRLHDDTEASEPD